MFYSLKSVCTNRHRDSLNGNSGPKISMQPRHLTERKIQDRKKKKSSIYGRIFHQWLSAKESACNAGDLGSILGSERSPGGGRGNPFQYSFWENLMDWGAWWGTVHRVTKSWTWLSDWAHMEELKTEENDNRGGRAALSNKHNNNNYNN